MKYVVLVALALIGAAALTGCARKPLTPVTPWADVAGDSLSFFTVSTDPGGLKVCYVFDWGDGSTTTTDYFMSGDTGYCLHELTGTKVRYIKVRARNEKGVASGWSPSLRFRLSEPPQLADTIIGLPRWTADRWYHASVRVTDPDADSVAVKFVWGDLPATGWSALVPSGSVVSDSCKWSVLGPHAVQVFLKDKGCAVSCPSQVKTVNVDSMAVVWYSDKQCYAATPTLGTIGGEPVLYCRATTALDCYTLGGRELWSVPISEGVEYAPSVSADGLHLYLTDYADNELICLDAQTGQRRWLLSMVGAQGTPALGPDGAIYAVTGITDCVLSRVRDYGDSGIVDWSVGLGNDGSYSDGAVVGRNGIVYLVEYHDPYRWSVLFAIDRIGTELWYDDTLTKWGGSLVIDGRDRIIVTDYYGGLYCYNPDGTLAWGASDPDGLCEGSTAVGRDDDVIVTDDNGRVMSFDSTGLQQWISPVQVQAENTPCIAQDSSVIAYDPDYGFVYAIGLQGNALWEFSLWDSLGVDKRRGRCGEGEGSPSPVIGPDGNLYLASEYGLYCLAHGGLRMANTAWPTYNHDAARSGWAGRH